MTWGDTLRLAFRNLGQARVRTALTVGGVSIGIASLSGMVSLGVGLQDQLVDRFTKSGMFDSITVTTMPLGRAGGPGGRLGGRGRVGATPAPSATPTPSVTPAPSATPAPAAVKLDDEAIRKLSELPSVKAVYPMLRVGIQVKFGDYTAKLEHWEHDTFYGHAVIEPFFDWQVKFEIGNDKPLVRGLEIIHVGWKDPDERFLFMREGK